MIEIDILPAPTPTPTSPSARKDAADEFASAMQDATGRESTPTGEADPERDDAQPDHPGPDRAADAARADHAAQNTPSPDGVGTAPDALSTLRTLRPDQSLTFLSLIRWTCRPLSRASNEATPMWCSRSPMARPKQKAARKQANAPTRSPTSWVFSEHKARCHPTRSDGRAAACQDHRGDSSIVLVRSLPGQCRPRPRDRPARRCRCGTDEIGLDRLLRRRSNPPTKPANQSTCPWIRRSPQQARRFRRRPTRRSTPPDRCCPTQSRSAFVERRDRGEAPAPSAVASPCAGTVPADVAVAAAVETLPRSQPRHLPRPRSTQQRLPRRPQPPNSTFLPRPSRSPRRYGTSVAWPMAATACPCSSTPKSSVSFNSKSLFGTANFTSGPQRNSSRPVACSRRRSLNFEASSPRQA